MDAEQLSDRSRISLIRENAAGRRWHPTILFMCRADRYRVTGDAWAFFERRLYHVPGIAARLSLTPIDAKVVHVTDLKATFPGMGEGRRLLETVCGMADDAGVVLSLDARGFGETRIEDEALVRWYRRFRFEVIASDTPEDGIAMARWPA